MPFAATPREVAQRRPDSAGEHEADRRGSRRQDGQLRLERLPQLLDRYLARSGYQAQQTDDAEDPERPDNLFAAVPGPYGAHGRFDAQSHRRSPWTRVARLLRP